MLTITTQNKATQHLGRKKPERNRNDMQTWWWSDIQQVAIEDKKGEVRHVPMIMQHMSNQGMQPKKAVSQAKHNHTNDLYEKLNKNNTGTASIV